jgi:PAS domain S-box-containing protein
MSADGGADDGSANEGGERLTTEGLRAIFNTVNDAIFVHDPDGRIVDVNRTAAELYGYSRSELRDGSVGPLSSGEPPYTRENATERIRRAAEGEAQRFEWRARDSDDRVFWQEVSLNRTVIDDAVRVLAICRRIDERKRTERRFQTLIDNLPGMVYRCRNESGWPMEFVGGQCGELTGYDAGAIESGAVNWGEEVIHPEDRERVDREVQAALDENEQFELTYRIRTADGTERWVWERGQRIEVPGTSGESLEGFITDVTERREAEQRLREQRDGLELLNQVLRHDIRNDLQVVTGYAEVLSEECDDETLHDHIETVHESADHAADLTVTARQMADVLLSRDEELHPVDLRVVLENELTELQTSAPGAVVTSETPIPAVTVRANDLLGAVFRNVLKNAVQHNDKDVPEVAVSVTTTEAVVRVRIADNGPGVPDAQKRTVFGKGEAGLESSGTGMGLYLVRTLVDSYGGEVWIEDNDPEGAVFVVELPRVE